MSKFLKSSLLFLSILAVTACESTINNRGFISDDELVAEIKAGVDNKESVRQMLGSPTTTTTFNSKDKKLTGTWYYVSETTETIAFFDPQILDRKVIGIEFGENDVVKSVKLLTADDGNNLTVVQDVSPTLGKELTFFQQIFQNLGRFNNQGGSQKAPPR
jgi:outer membrane protein assembly factor BamE (lipoprotein component of BamABCDE complex)